MKHFRRKQFDLLKARLEEERHFIQVVVGPRQVGKTTLIQQLLEELEMPRHYVSADAQLTADSSWIAQQWETARIKLKASGMKSDLLVIDEIQKIQNWSEAVKKEWDEDSRRSLPLKVVLLGSAQLLLQQGLTESLAGRFEVVRMSHWSEV